MNPGDLRHRITLQSQPTTQDSYGAPAGDYTDVATVWANINPIAGKELFAAEQFNSEITHRVRIRYRSGVNPSMRVKYGTRTFEIMYVINEYERDNIIQLMCKELV